MRELTPEEFDDLLTDWTAIFEKYGITALSPVPVEQDLALIRVGLRHAPGLGPNAFRAMMMVSPGGPTVRNTLAITCEQPFHFFSISVKKTPPQYPVEPPPKHDIGLTVETIQRITIECFDVLTPHMGEPIHANECYNSVAGMVLTLLNLGYIAYPDEVRNPTYWAERRQELGYPI